LRALPQAIDELIAGIRTNKLNSMTFPAICQWYFDWASTKCTFVHRCGDSMATLSSSNFPFNWPWRFQGRALL